MSERPNRKDIEAIGLAALENMKAIEKQVFEDTVAGIEVALASFLLENSYEDTPVVLVGYYTTLAAVVAANPMPVSEIQHRVERHIRKCLHKSLNEIVVDVESGLAAGITQAKR